MLAFVQRRFGGGGWSPGDNQPFRQLTVKVKPGDAFGPLTALKDIRRFAKKHRILNMTYRSSYYERPTTRRMREASERAYFNKWEYLKYCSSVVDYAIKNDLQFRTPVSVGCSNRLSQVCSDTPVPPKIDGLSEEEILRMAQSFYNKP